MAFPPKKAAPAAKKPKSKGKSAPMSPTAAKVGAAMMNAPC